MNTYNVGIVGIVCGALCFAAIIFGGVQCDKSGELRRIENGKAKAVIMTECTKTRPPMECGLMMREVGW